MILIKFDGHKEKQEEGLLRRLEAILRPGFTGYEITRVKPEKPKRGKK